MAFSRPPYPLINLACAALAGPWSRAGLLDRVLRAFPQDSELMRQVVRRLLKTFGKESAPTYGTLLRHLQGDTALATCAARLRVGEHFSVPLTMEPRGSAALSWNLPALTSPAQLADWLNVPLGRLYWLADMHGWTVRQPSLKLRHYVNHWQPRRSRTHRLIESPKPTLKRMQRKILREILDRIPPHAAAHGFRAGRSSLSYAAPHAGKRIVLRFDLRDFFPSVRVSRVHALFRTAGYPDEVARLLTDLCSTSMAEETWEQRPETCGADAPLRELLRRRHLPQGAPTSPALANLCAYRLDVRLLGLAATVEAEYTRYADDLAFSGGERLERSARRFQVAAAVIVADEGFEMHFKKSRFMRQGVCQQLAGIVLNEHANIRRAKYDELKAILYNCAKHGPQSQDRARHSDFRAHLLGRIAHMQMICPQRAERLRRLFQRIVW